MTDEHPIDALEQAFTEYVANKAPADVVRGPGLTRDALLGLDLLAANKAIITWPGEVLTDPDGLPIAVGESRTEEATVAGVVVSRRELESAGLTEADVPHLTVLG